MRYEAIGDPTAWTGPVDRPEGDLALLGFRRIGLCAARDGGEGVFRGPDAWLNAWCGDVAAEVWANADDTVLGVCTHWVDGPILQLLSITEEGTALETVRRPARPPVTRLDEELDAFGGPKGWVVACYPRPLWSRGWAPVAGIEVELLPTHDAAELLEGHIARRRGPWRRLDLEAFVAHRAASGARLMAATERVGRAADRVWWAGIGAFVVGVPAALGACWWAAGPAPAAVLATGLALVVQPLNGMWLGGARRVALRFARAG